jgi:hypothetical protein
MTDVETPSKRIAPWRGRPRVNDPKSRRVAVRLTDEQLTELDTRAASAGLSIGAFARAALLGAPGPRAKRRPSYDVRELARLFGELGKIGSNINQLSHHAHLTQTLPAVGELQAMRQAVLQMHDALLRALHRMP